MRTDLIIDVVATVFLITSYFPIVIGLSWAQGMKTNTAMIMGFAIAVFILVGIWL
jgi:hypothetical protein